MRPNTPGENQRLRLYQDGAMQDTCIILRYTEGTKDTYNLDSDPTYPPSDPIICGYKPKPQSKAEITRPDKTVIQVAATLRLPRETEIDLLDRVQITHIKGEELTSPLIYGLVGPIQVGVSGLVVELEEVST